MRLVEQLYAMDKNLIFSGQLFFRHAGRAISLDLTTRELFSVAGIIAVPKHLEIKGETQYPIAGFNHETEGIILGLDHVGYEMKERARGKTIGQLLTEPIWKI